jgi:anti-anti-sigma factor
MVVTFGETLTISGARAMQSALLELIDAPNYPAMDLSAVEQCDAAATQVLYSAMHTALKSGKRIRLLGVSETVTETLAMLGISLTELSERRSPGHEGDPGAA